MKNAPNNAHSGDPSLAGSVYGDLTVISPGKQGKARWLCRCACGAEREYTTRALQKARSCGSHKTSAYLAALSARNTVSKKYQGVHDSSSPLWQVWRSMHRRCSDTSHQAYDDYGGRGITVSSDWATFEAFSAWAVAAGYQRGFTIERLNNDGDYTPANCAWVTQEQQNRNKRSNIHLAAFGESKLLVDWSRDPRCAVGYGTLHRRVASGWPAEKAISTTSRKATGDCR